MRLRPVHLLAATSIPILGALAFEHLGGYMPCALCLEQRLGYYAAFPILLVASLAQGRADDRRVGLALIVVSVLLAASAGLGGWHVGIEIGWWPGPADCSAPASLAPTTDLLATIDAVRPPSCSEAALRILGVSLAGWNMVAASALSIAAFATGWRMARTRDESVSPVSA